MSQALASLLSCGPSPAFPCAGVRYPAHLLAEVVAMLHTQQEQLRQREAAAAGGAAAALRGGGSGLPAAAAGGVKEEPPSPVVPACLKKAFT